MNEWLTKQGWETDCFLLRSVTGAEGLERRLSTLGNRMRGTPRRMPIWSGVLLATLAPALLVPWRLSASAAEAPAATLAQQWEDLLLLEAMRYLHLSSAQVRQFQPLAETAEEQLSQAAERQAALRKPLAQIAARQREALLSGEPISLEEQAEALRLEKALAPLRKRAEEELTARIAPRLGRLLNTGQTERAFLLSHGEMPRGTARRPALLDPESGFVLDPRERELSLRGARQHVLARNYGSDLAQIAADSAPGWAGRWVELLKTPEHSGAKAQDPCGSCHASAGEDANRGTSGAYFRVFGLQNGNQRPDEARLAAVERDRLRLDALPDLARIFAYGGSDADRAEAVKGLTRRLFSSPRLRTVIEARLRQGEDLPAPVLPPEGEQ